VIANYKKTEIETGLKKTYATLSNALNMAIKDYGGTNTWNIPVSDKITMGKDFAEKYFIPYLKIAKECGDSQSSDCKYDFFTLKGKVYYPMENGEDYYNRYYLADGSAIMLFPTLNEDGTLKQIIVAVDANGWKKPNKLGIDVHIFMIGTELNDAKKFYSWNFTGYKDPQKNIVGWYGVCNTQGAENSSGLFCTNLIRRNGWKIPSIDEYVKMAGGDNSYREKYPWKF